MREANKEVIINENGKQKAVKKIELAAKQVMNKAATGSVQTLRLLVKFLEHAEERAAEQQQNSPNKRDYSSLRAEDLSDDELAWIIRNGVEKSTSDDVNKPVADRTVVAP